MSSVDETTAQVIRAARRRRKERRRSAFELWAWEPIIVLRVALFATYLLHVGLAVMASVAGVPIFRLTGSEGWTTPWALSLAVFALLAAIGSTDDRWHVLERWASLGVTGFSFGYVLPLYLVGFASGDINRQVVAVAVSFMLILPASRFAWLASKTGRLHHGRGEK